MEKLDNKATAYCLPMIGQFAYVLSFTAQVFLCAMDLIFFILFKILQKMLNNSSNFLTQLWQLINLMFQLINLMLIFAKL